VLPKTEIACLQAGSNPRCRPSGINNSKSQHDLSEGSVVAGYIVVRSAVGIDQADTAGFAVQAGKKFQSAAGQRPLPAELSRSHRRCDGGGEAGVVEKPEFLTGDIIDHR
jgi:hypothetical protein